MPSPSVRSALASTAPYFLLGLVWILVSDRLLLALIPDSAELSEWQTIKGWVFVALSSGLVFGLFYRVHRSRERLKARNVELDTIFNHTTDFMVRFDRGLRHRFVNQALADASGIPVADYLGRTNEELGMPSEETAFWNRHLRNAFRTGRPEEMEFQITTPGGARDYQSVIVPECDDAGAVESLLCITRDVTRLKEVERALRLARDEAERMNRLQASFLASMSHEIRTPLTSILGFTEILQDEIDDASLKALVEPIQRNGRRLYETLNSVLEVSRLEAGTLALRLEKQDVVEVVRDAVHLLKPRAAGRDLAMRLEVPDAPHYLHTDAPLLHRIVTNLVTNAVKFTPAGAVTVRLTRRDAGIRLEVEDTGVGIDPTFRPHLFEAFRQASTGHGRTHEGSGLGLTITRHLVHLLGGTIAVASTPGEGTTFTVDLPEPPHAAVPGRPAAAPQTA